MRGFLLFFYILGGIALTLGVGSRALRTIHMPFAGLLPFQNLYIGAFTQPDWAGGNLGLTYHDRIVAVDDLPINPDTEWNSLLKSPASELMLTFQKRSGPIQARVTVLPLSSDDVFHIFAPLFGTGMAFLMIGFLVLLISPAPPGAFPFVLYCACTGIYFLLAYDFHTTYSLVYLLLIAFALIPATVIHLSVSFPRPFPETKFILRVVAVAYFLSLVLLIPYVALFRKIPSHWVYFEYAFFLYLSLAYLVWASIIAYRALCDDDLGIRKQCKIILIPLLPAFGSIFVVGWLVFLFEVSLPLNWVVPLCLVFPGAIAFGMFRNNLFLVDHLERQIQERTDALQKAHIELQETTKLKAVGLLAAGTAHEIGNAMNLIASNLPVLKNYSYRLLSLMESNRIACSEEQKSELDFEFMKSDLPQLLTDLERGANRAIEIVTDLKAFAKPLESQKSNVDLPQLIDSVLRLLQSKIGSHIEVRTAYQRVPSVLGSASQIQQVIVNLFLNSLEALNGSGTILISVYEEKGRVVTTIKDSGPGIAADHLPRLFEPFYSTKETGSGLGLAVTYGIVESHGGKISIASPPGEGTIVSVALPIS